MTTGQRIKAARLKAGMTQAELAKKLGVAYQNIGQFERDVRKPKYETLERIAGALNVEVQSLDDRFNFSIRLEDFLGDGPPPSHKPDFRLVNSDGSSIRVSMETVTGQLLYSFSNLNKMGQKEAIRRIDELTEVPKYQSISPNVKHNLDDPNKEV